MLWTQLQSPTVTFLPASMNKAELVNAIAVKAQVSQKLADSILSTMLETIVEAVSKGDKVSFVGFGTFEARQRQARTGQNPRTGEKLEIPATTVPAFSAGKGFKDKVATNGQ